MSAPLLDRVRVYESVRTAHLERAATLHPASILYRVRRYDFDADLADGLPLVPAGPLRTVRLLWGATPRELEVNEPLMLSAVPTAALAVATVRLRNRFRRARTRVVTYAIGNADPFVQAADAARVGLKSRVRRRGETWLARWVWARLDVVVFGTDGAREVYQRLLGPTTARQLTVPALPSPCSCAAMEGGDAGTGPSAADRAGRVLFLGALAERKGIEKVLRAWPEVRRQRPDARLRIVGKGALQDAVEAAAATDPTIEVLIDPPRARIHEELAGAAVLVLPSQPTRTWREQVGLPIVEALAHGARVVTTTETGLADWLTAHGHRVVDGHADAADLAAATVAALTAGPDPDEVRATLPSRDGRLAADDAMFG